MECKLCARTKNHNPNRNRQRNRKNRRERSKRVYIKALLSGYKWKRRSLTYGFHDGRGMYYRAWDATQKANVVSGIKAWEKTCGLTFTATSYSKASLKFHLVGNSSYPYLGHAFFPVGKNKGKIFISHHNAIDKSFNVGGYDYITIVHEIGHSLGLSHTHDGTRFPGVKNPTSGGLNNQNVILNTVMGYNDLNGPLTSKRRTNYGFVAGPMAYDVNAIQRLYGKPPRSTANDTYIMNNNFYQNIVDTGGTDTIVSTSDKNTTIDLRAATVDGRKATGGGAASHQEGVKGGFTISKGSVIENATTGDGDDTLRGNSASNRLRGNGGNDRFIASAGKDYFYGGTGSDRVIFKGARKNYTVTKLGKKKYKVVGKGKYLRLSGTTFLLDIEHAKFGRQWHRLT